MPTSRSAAFSRTARTITALDGAAGRPWFLPAVAAFPLADYALPFLPNQVLLVALCVLQPRRWWQFAIAFVLAGSLGAILTTLVIQTLGAPAVDGFVGDSLEGGAPAGLEDLIEQYGLWALALLAMLPWPPRTAVVVCALAGLAPLEIGIAVALGRVVPTAAYTLLAARAPQILRRFKSVDRVLREVDALRCRRHHDIAND